MGNPFPIGNSSTRQAVHGAARDAGTVLGSVGKGVKFVFLLPFRAVDLVLNPARPFSRMADRNDVQLASTKLTRWKGLVENNPAFQPNLDQAAREFNTARGRLGFTNGKLGASFQGLGHAIQTKIFGMDAAKVGSARLPKDIAKATEKALSGGRAGWIERIMSKPIRVAANHPRVAAVIGVGAAIMGIGGWMRDRAEQRTKIEALNAMAATTTPPAMANPYMNSVTPEESYVLNERMRGGSGARGDFAAGIQASRQAATTPPTQA